MPRTHDPNCSASSTTAMVYIYIYIDRSKQEKENTMKTFPWRAFSVCEATKCTSSTLAINIQLHRVVINSPARTSVTLTISILDLPVLFL